MTNPIKNIILFLIFVVFFLSVEPIKAQETNFSQFYNTPMQTNPGMIATSNQFKGVYNYRRQTVSGSNTFSTSNVSLSAPYKYRRTTEDGEEEQKRILAFGMSMLNDVVGDNGLLKTNGIEGAIALNLPWEIFSSGDNVIYDTYLSIGIQGGFFQRGIDVNAVITGSQFSDGVFNPSLPSGENFSRENISYSSYSAGVFWYSQDADEITRRYVGFAVHNINQPNISFLEDDQAILPMRLTFKAGYDVIGDKYSAFSLQPNIRWIQVGNFAQFTIGALARYNINASGGESSNEEGFNVSAGIWYNNTNGMIAMAGAENSRFVANVSYDMALLNSQNITGASALELTIGIKLGKTKRQIAKENIFPIAEDLIDSQEDPIEEDNNNIEEGEENNSNSQDNDSNDIIEKDVSIFDDNLMFFYADVEILDGAKEQLDEMAEMMLAYPTIKIQIDGHACNIKDTEEENNRLSLQRAANVKEYLVSKGVDPQRIVTSGYGSTQPIASNDTETGRVQNRRVEFELIQE